MKKYVVKLEEFKKYGSVKTIISEAEEVGKKGMEYINKGYILVTESGLDELVEERRKAMSKDWVEITQDEYYDALNVRPPIAWYNGGFFSSEATWWDMHAFYIEYKGKYYSSCQSVFDKREDIVNKLKEYIGA